MMNEFTLIEMHLALNHAPFFTILFGVLFLIYGRVKKETLFLRIGFTFVAVSAVISALVFLSGEMAHDTVARFAGVEHEDIEMHETAAKYLMITMATLGLLMVYGHFRFGSDEIPNWFGMVTIIISFSAIFLLIHAQKLGGEIRHPEVRSYIDRSKLLVKEHHHEHGEHEHGEHEHGEHHHHHDQDH